MKNGTLKKNAGSVKFLLLPKSIESLCVSFFIVVCLILPVTFLYFAIPREIFCSLYNSSALLVEVNCPLHFKCLKTSHMLVVEVVFVEVMYQRVNISY